MARFDDPLALQFLAPELARGEERDARTDVFVLAAILFRASTGADLREGSSSMMVYRAARSGGVRKPSEIVPGFPAAIEEVVLKGLSADAAERYSDAAALGAALEMVLDEAAIEPETGLLADLARSAIDARARR